ncbi:MAG TPA: DUF6152 family protein [Acidobacteriota bacterium]|nr:DUF6152 family protein [Acidobacteriota bacterium]
MGAIPVSGMMMYMRVLVIGAAILCFYAPTAWSHHAFAATYVLDRTVTIEGTVVEFLFRNPHSVVLVKAPGDGGRPVTWAVEWGDGGQLSRQGIEKDTLKPGDHVIVAGNPSRNSADRRMRMQDIVRSSDGWKWRSGSQ